MPPVCEASTKPSAATVLPAPVACSNQKRLAAFGSSGCSPSDSSSSPSSTQSRGSSSAYTSSSGSSSGSPSGSSGSSSSSSSSSSSGAARCTGPRSSSSS